MRLSRYPLGTALLLLCAQPLTADTGKRTQEIVRRDCHTAFGRQEVTLFANGTLRLRQQLNEEDSLELAELRPEELEAFVNRLTDEDLSEVEEGRVEVEGDWVERCRIRLQLPGQQPPSNRFGRFDSLPLALARVNRVVDDMVVVTTERSPATGLPHDYVPRPGDVLERKDGVRFKVVGLTGDKRGIELTGLEQPLTLFVAHEALGELFVSVVQRRSRP